jgi:hypothetical protein
MYFKTLLAAGFVLFLVSSCKKNSSSGSSNGSKLKMYIEDTYVAGTAALDSFLVAYDNDGRMTGLISPQLSIKYSYNGDEFHNRAL